MRLRRYLLAAGLALAAPTAAIAAPCAGFNDVNDTNTFCSNIEWIKNRAVTLGCLPGLYCPSEFVPREQMAAFINRLGNVLTPEVQFTEGVVAASDFSSDPVVCQTSAVGVTGYPRSAKANAAINLRSLGSFDANMNVVMSTDGGQTWTPMTSNDFMMHALGSYGDFSSGSAFTGNASLDVGQSYVFGLKLTRTVGTGEIQDGSCHVAIELRSRTGASSPL